MSTASTSDQTETHTARASVGSTLAGGMVLLLAAMVVQRAIGFIRGILFCRWLGPAELGLWDVGFGFLTLAAPLAALGLPGSFGRYLEHYRRQGMLGTFLRRTATFTGIASLIAVAAMFVGRRTFAELIFGGAEHATLVTWLAVALAAIVAYNFLVSLSIAMRRPRLVSGLQFVNALAFAAIGVGLVRTWRPSAESVVIAYGASSALAAIGAIWILSRETGPSVERTSLPQWTFWARLLPFAGWVWMSDLVGNLFEVADRFVLLHYSGVARDEAIRLVGQYSSARVVPLLFLSVAELLAALVLPHLSEDWERGDRRAVRDRLNLVLKLLAFGLTAAGTGLLIAAPWLFDVAFAGRFGAGREILPWTIAYCSFAGLTVVVQCYLWCAERARLSTLAVALGLAADITLNLLLVPRLGLWGAVYATTAARLAVLLLMLELARRQGMRFGMGTCLVVALPGLVCLGPWTAAAGLCGVGLAAISSGRLFNPEEKRSMAETCRAGLARLGFGRFRLRGRGV